jgi:S-adenosylmethionine synthetase
MLNARIKRLAGKRVSDLDSELVERKGVGHPDSLMDGIAERVSNELCETYLNTEGCVLHHNVDKGLIVGGEANVLFKGGKITKKIEVIVAGRVTRLNSRKINVDEIAIDAAKKYLKDKTRFLDVENEVIFTSKLSRGSTELRRLIEERVPLANDTAFGIGFAPLSETERLVLQLEKYLNAADYKKGTPSVGEDIKVMGLREDQDISLTVAIAFVSKFIENAQNYSELKEGVREDIARFAKKLTGKEVEVSVNTGDDVKEGSIYMTKTGLSCESGDDGCVGRGNRVNGLITPFRHMSLEAVAGKNPVNHVDKIYNILAMEIANDAVSEYPEIKECNVSIVSQIGRRIDEPRSFRMEVGLSPIEFKSMENRLRRISEWHIEKIGKLSEDVIKGKYELF